MEGVSERKDLYRSLVSFIADYPHAVKFLKDDKGIPIKL
jgi:hypothetical protein